MNPWKEWAKLHGNLFGLISPKHTEMLYALASHFVSHGYSPEEVTAATRWLAANDPPAFPQAHLKALQGRLKAVRTERQADARQEAPEVSCGLCHGCGSVDVPCPLAHARGDYRTYPVLCVCPLGVFIHRDQMVRWPTLKPARKPQLTLAEYEQDLGGEDWRAVLAEMKRRQWTELHAAELAREGDARHGRSDRPQAWAGLVDAIKRRQD